MDIDAVAQPSQPRRWSWAPTTRDVEDNRAHASMLIGEKLVGVRYWTLDYQGWDRFPDWEGPRPISAPDEWVAPCWRYGRFDACDYGVEFETDTGLVYSVTWDPPGYTEGLGIRRLPMLGAVIPPDKHVAVWDVGGRSRWVAYIGCTVTGLDLRYLPWDDADGSWWCRHITLQFARRTVDLLLGEPRDDELHPSADNVAVVFDSDPLPSWLDHAQ